MLGMVREPHSNRSELIGTVPQVDRDSELLGTVETWSEGNNDSIHELAGWLDDAEEWEWR